MKRNFTMLSILCSCFMLAASARAANRLKFLVYIAYQDTSKTPAHLKDSLKLPATLPNTDSAVLLATTLKQSINNVPSTANYTDRPRLRLESVNSQATTNNNIKLLTDLLITDTTKALVPVVIDSLKLTENSSAPDSANLAPLANSTDSLMLRAAIIQNESINRAAAIAHAGNLKSLTSVYQLDSLKSSLLEAKLLRDSVTRQIMLKQKVTIARLLKIDDPDSLKIELKHTTSDTLKAFIYTRLANFYLNYDTISSKKKQLAYQNEALSYTLLALHHYSRYDDTTGLRMSFDNLAKVYYKQKKYSQAKWFILQSNSLSREKNDVPNIISSLLTLAIVKTDIKDYTLAMGDLDEAMQLSITNHLSKAQLNVLQSYANLYHKLKNYPKEIAMIKKRDSLEESIRKNEVAQLAAQNAIQKRSLIQYKTKKKYIPQIHASLTKTTLRKK